MTVPQGTVVCVCVIECVGVRVCVCSCACVSVYVHVCVGGDVGWAASNVSYMSMYNSFYVYMY